MHKLGLFFAFFVDSIGGIFLLNVEKFYLSIKMVVTLKSLVVLLPVLHAIRVAFAIHTSKACR